MTDRNQCRLEVKIIKEENKSILQFPEPTLPKREVAKRTVFMPQLLLVTQSEILSKIPVVHL